MIQIFSPEISYALGHSFIYDEYRGNFAKACQIAVEQLNKARQDQEKGTIADALLSLGVIYMLQGKSKGAIESFEQIEKLIPGDAKLRLRAISFSNLAEYQRFNFFPNGSGSNGLEIQARWNSVDYAKKQEHLWNEQSRHVDDPSVLLEARIVYKMLSNLLPVRSMLENTNTLEQSTVDRLLKLALKEPLELRLQLESKGDCPRLLAYIDRVIADIFWRANYFDQAQQYLNQARTTYSQANDLIGIATCRMMLGDWMAASFSSPVVWDHILEEGDIDKFWLHEGVEFDISNINVSGTQNAYAEAEKLFSMAGAGCGLAALQLRYSFIASLMNKYDDVVEHATLARQYYDAAGDNLGYWLAQAHRVLGLLGTDKRIEDIATAEAAGNWGRENGSFSFIFGIGLMFARAGRKWLLFDGDYQRALSCCRLSQALFNRLDAIINVAQSQVNQGIIYEIIGEQAASLTAYERAFDLYKEAIQKRPAIANAAWQQANLLGTKIWNIYVKQRNADGIELSTKKLKSLFEYRSGSSIPNSLDLVSRRILEIPIDNLETNAKVLVPLYRAQAAQDEDRYEEAQKQFELALATASKVATPEREFLEATVFGSMHRYPEAVTAFQSYLDDSSISSGFGTVSSLLGKITNSKNLLHKKSHIEDTLLLQQQEQGHQSAAMFFTRVRAYTEAKKHLDSLEQLEGQNWWNKNVHPWEMLSLYGEIHAGMGELTLALAFCNRAISNLEARRALINCDQLKTALTSGQDSQYLYYHAALTASKMQNAALSFDYAERGKSRALLDLMSSSASLAKAPHTDSQLMRTWHQVNAQLALWHELSAFELSKSSPNKNRIGYLNQKIEKDGLKLRQMEIELATHIPNFHQLINPQVSTLSVEGVSAVLPLDTALLEYYFLEDDLLIWAITKNGLVSTHRASVDVRKLISQIRSFHNACANQRMMNNQGIKLSEILLAPLDEVLNTYSRLLIVPHGVSHLLPFHVLPWHGEPLAASHIISYLPSASTLQFLQAAAVRKQPDSILTIGNPANMSLEPLTGGERIHLQDLPGAAAEAAFVASFFPHRETLIGDQATESVVSERLNKYPIIHFATHGCLSEETPLLSSIMLANGESLNIYELMGLQLDADLVVLSACQTALGKTTGGDDVLGLTRGLLAAGARTAVVSLWPVNDSSTCLLMGEFYRRLIQNGSEPVSAMQAAQNYLRNLDYDKIRSELERLRNQIEITGASDALKRDFTCALDNLKSAGIKAKSTDYSHPFYWAPFIVVGRF